MGEQWGQSMMGKVLGVEWSGVRSVWRTGVWYVVFGCAFAFFGACRKYWSSGTSVLSARISTLSFLYTALREFSHIGNFSMFFVVVFVVSFHPAWPLARCMTNE